FDTVRQRFVNTHDVRFDELSFLPRKTYGPDTYEPPLPTTRSPPIQQRQIFDEIVVQPLPPPPVVNTAVIEPDPMSYQEAIASPNAPQWIAAMKDEMSSIDEHDTWTLTPAPPGRKIIGSREVQGSRRCKRIHSGGRYR